MGQGGGSHERCKGMEVKGCGGVRLDGEELRSSKLGRRGYFCD